MESRTRHGDHRGRRDDLYRSIWRARRRHRHAVARRSSAAGGTRRWHGDRSRIDMATVVYPRGDVVRRRLRPTRPTALVRARGRVHSHRRHPQRAGVPTPTCSGLAAPIELLAERTKVFEHQPVLGSAGSTLHGDQILQRCHPHHRAFEFQPGRPRT